MRQSLRWWQFFAFLFTGVFGVLLHFLFDLSGGSLWAAPFSAVNESIWEHLKLLFFPMLVFAVLEYRRIGKDYDSFWCVKLRGILLGLVLIPVLYYTVQGIFGASPDWLNITIFFVTAAVVYLAETRWLKNNSLGCKSPQRAVFILCLIAVLFGVLTFFPLKLPLFQDPVTKTYGYFML